VAEMKVEGFQHLLDEVAKLGKEGAKIENKALREAGNLVRESIKGFTPVIKVGGGTLKESITISGIRTKDGIKYVEIKPEAYYGRFLELGTTKMDAKPYMSPGYESSKAEAYAIIEQELKKGLGL